MKKLATVSSFSLLQRSQKSSLHSALAMARQKRGTLVTAPAISAWPISRMALTWASLEGTMKLIHLIRFSGRARAVLGEMPVGSRRSGWKGRVLMAMLVTIPRQPRRPV